MIQLSVEAWRISDLHAIIDVIPNPVIVKDGNHNIVMINQSACAFFGYPREELLRLGDHLLFPPDQVEVFHRADDRVFNSGKIDEIEEEVTDGQGVIRSVITRKQKIVLNGEDFLVGTITDVTSYRQAEAQNRYLAFHDVLTGLPNRALLNERIDQTLLRVARKRSDCALIYVDLDRFKDVNDSYGHPAGDELVRQFAGRITSILRASDTAARLGGDEFAVLIQDTGEGIGAHDICERIVSAAARPFDLEQGRVHISASVGITLFDGSDLDRTALHQRADMALYQAKREGRGCFRIFSPTLEIEIRNKRLLEADLRAAVVGGEGIEIDYQPLFAAREGRIVAFEALVRWRHPRLGLLLPAEFLEIAEVSGLIVPLGDWVLATACRTFQNWPDISLAVNFSPAQLASENMVERVLATLAETGFDPRRLQIEVTEHAILDVDVAVARLSALRKVGIQLVLDDFGTGYSSLSHLQKLDIDKVKIDRSFVQDVGNMRESRAIVRAVARLGRSLGVAVTAEGVETEEQRSFLRTLGCQELQGYLLSRPLEENEALKLLQFNAAERLSA